jgi:hypothetical protein
MDPEERPDPSGPRPFEALPGRTGDTVTTYEQLLTELVELLGAQGPPPPSDPPDSRWAWQHQARRAIGQAVRRPPLREDWFEPLIRAAVHDPDPSFNRQLVEPALGAYGRRRVQLALIEYLRRGSDPERAGAARAWYWTLVPLTYRAGSRTPTPESAAEYDAVADLRTEWRETALQVFITNEDLDVRRCILPGLSLRTQDYPEALWPTVAEATRIARTHPDEYLRHRVEHQV